MSAHQHVAAGTGFTGLHLLGLLAALAVVAVVAWALADPATRRALAEVPAPRLPRLLPCSHGADDPTDPHADHLALVYVATDPAAATQANPYGAHWRCRCAQTWPPNAFTAGRTSRQQESWALSVGAARATCRQDVIEVIPGDVAVIAVAPDDRTGVVV